jgi:hypothetical protein
VAQFPPDVAYSEACRLKCDESSYQPTALFNHSANEPFMGEDCMSPMARGYHQRAEYFFAYGSFRNV